jgi:hypothetical protein
MRRGFGCTLTVAVTNHSDRAVTVERIVFPFGGPDARAAYKVTLVNGGFSGVHDRIDATSDLQWALDPGETQLVNVPLAFRDNGCSSEDGWITVQATIEVTSLTASHDLKVADLPAFLGTTDSSCDT